MDTTITDQSDIPCECGETAQHYGGSGNQVFFFCPECGLEFVIYTAEGEIKRSSREFVPQLSPSTSRDNIFTGALSSAFAH